MNRKPLAVLLVLALALAPMTAVAIEDPRFETYVPEPTLDPGQTTQLTVHIENDAADPDDRVEPAHDVRATMESGDTPFTIRSGIRFLGTLRDGQRTASTFTLSVPRNIEAGTYQIPIRLTYRPDGEDERVTRTVYAQVTVRDHARFEVVDTSTDAQVGDSGTVSLQLKNVGSAPANSASVTLQSPNAAITFGKSASVTRYVGNVGVNETVTVEYEADVSTEAETRPYSLTAQVTYDDQDGETTQSAPLRVGITPLPEQTFSLSNTQSTLRVGEKGTLTVTVTNDGPGPANDAVVVLERIGQNIERLETEVAVGTLAQGESTTVEFPIEVTSSAEPGPKQFSVHVDYQNDAGADRQSDTLRTRVEVAEERDRFGLEPVSATITAGRSGTLELAVTNNGDDTVRNVNAKLFADGPIGASDDEAFITAIEPGETQRLTFGISAAGSALEKAYPVNLDFQYDVDGETKLSKTYTVAVDVTRPADSGGPPIQYIAGGALAVIAILGYAIYRRR